MDVDRWLGRTGACGRLALSARPSGGKSASFERPSKYDYEELKEIVRGRLTYLITAVLLVVVVEQIVATIAIYGYTVNDIQYPAILQRHPKIDRIKDTYLNDANKNLTSTFNAILEIIDATQKDKSITDGFDKYVASIATALTALSLFLAVVLFQYISRLGFHRIISRDLTLVQCLVVVFQLSAVALLLLLRAFPDKSYVSLSAAVIAGVHLVSLVFSLVETCIQTNKLERGEGDGATVAVADDTNDVGDDTNDDTDSVSQNAIQMVSVPVGQGQGPRQPSLGSLGSQSMMNQQVPGCLGVFLSLGGANRNPPRMCSKNGHVFIARVFSSPSTREVWASC